MIRRLTGAFALLSGLAFGQAPQSVTEVPMPPVLQKYEPVTT